MILFWFVSLSWWSRWSRGYDPPLGLSQLKWEGCSVRVTGGTFLFALLARIFTYPITSRPSLTIHCSNLSRQLHWHSIRIFRTRGVFLGWEVPSECSTGEASGRGGKVVVAAAARVRSVQVTGESCLFTFHE